MFQEFYNNSNLLAWPLLGLGIFVTSFMLVLYYVFAVISKNDRDKMAALPLEQESTGGSRNDR
ncbi:hypothetical protein HN388_00220 [bacterium]|jgi:cbb3-type cytochrome oxidase subunit 3|nr:hypothetical protein [bacterium]MBT4291294.1 hypothetical protein [bacterium]